MTLTSGTRLGRYEILGPLGAGGMGEVYRARDARLEREAAVKVLPAELASDPERLRRFEKEARAASALSHPNIVTIYEIGTEGATSFIAMERVEGQTLRELLVPGAMAQKKLLAIGTQIADGLARAHEAGIVHRDLKPENVMVTRDGLVKILDFGLAKLTSTMSGSDEGSNLPTMTGTTPGVVVGTVGYMSPEQASGQPLDFRSDQFALGSILYEMATGKRAFARKTPIDTLAAILNEEPEPVAAISPQTPTPLRWTVERCLAKDPGDRYASTRDLARDLATMRDRLSEISSGAVGVVGPPPRRTAVRAARALALAAALGVAFFLLGRTTVRVAPLTFRRLTFRYGEVGHARFAPDGQTVVYDASWNGQASEIFVTRRDNPISRALGVKGATLEAISSQNELAILRGETLARMPLAGGAPRDLVEAVSSADWSPDGKELAIVKDGRRLESPPGRLVYETKTGDLVAVAFSRDGRFLAVGDHPTNGSEAVKIFDREGKLRTHSEGWGSTVHPVWSPKGDEVWFSAMRETGSRQLWALDLSGRSRLVATFPGGIYFLDAARTGEVLVSRQAYRQHISGKLAGFPAERELDWFDSSRPACLSDDGTVLIFDERGESSSAGHTVYLRRAADADPVRLGDGYAAGLSRDGRWVATEEPGTGKLVLLPTGAGEARRIELSPPMAFFPPVVWLPDGRTLILNGSPPGRAVRAYRVDGSTGKAAPFGPEGHALVAVSPDGKRAVVVSDDRTFLLCSIETGETRPLPGQDRKDANGMTWGADGRILFVHQHAGKATNVYRLDVETGRRELFLALPPPDPSGVATGPEPLISADGKSYVYGYTRAVNDLYLVEGLR